MCLFVLFVCFGAVFCFLSLGNFVLILGFKLYFEKEVKVGWAGKKTGEVCDQNRFKLKIALNNKKSKSQAWWSILSRYIMYLCRIFKQ